MSVRQCRNGISIWSGTSKYFMWKSSGASTGNAHGRRNTGHAGGQWEVGDVVTTAAQCPDTSNTYTPEGASPSPAHISHSPTGVCR